MSTKLTMPANPIEHLRYDQNYADNYKQTAKDVTGRSWEIRLYHWAETGSLLSKICRWAVVFFSVAPVFAVLHDKIKGVEASHKAIEKIVTATYSDHKKIYDRTLQFPIGDPITAALIDKYTIEKAEVADEDILYQGLEVILDDQLDPEKVDLLEKPDGSEVSVERAASLYATLTKKDYSDLKPEAEKYLEKTHQLTKVTIIDDLETPFQMNVARDDAGRQYLKCSKTFEVRSANTVMGHITIDRNYNPHAKDTVTLKYKPLAHPYEMGSLEDLP